jgi:hypothetical protein
MVRSTIQRRLYVGSHALKHQFPARIPTFVVEEPVRALIVPKQGVTVRRQGLQHPSQSC